MSTVKTTYIQHPSAASPNLELAADGTVVLPLSDLEDLQNVSGTPAAGDKLVFDGSGWQPLSGYLYAGTRYYTSSGTFAKADPLGTGDIGLRAIRVRCVGGGGAGGGAGATSASEYAAGEGGGGGAYSERFYSNIASLDASVTVTRGAGGAGASGTTGNVGADSEFGTSGDAWHTLAKGGNGGRTVTQTAAWGGFGPTQIAGAGNVGDIAANPSRSGDAFLDPSLVLGTRARSGEGGVAGRHYGPGGAARRDNATGSDGDSPASVNGAGGGGGGAVNSPSQVARTGGAGQNGIVIIDCFV